MRIAGLRKEEGEVKAKAELLEQENREELGDLLPLETQSQEQAPAATVAQMIRTTDVLLPS